MSPFKWGKIRTLLRLNWKFCFFFHETFWMHFVKVWICEWFLCNSEHVSPNTHKDLLSLKWICSFTSPYADMYTRFSIYWLFLLTVVAFDVSLYFWKIAWFYPLWYIIWYIRKKIQNTELFQLQYIVRVYKWFEKEICGKKTKNYYFAIFLFITVLEIKIVCRICYRYNL